MTRRKNLVACAWLWSLMLAAEPGGGGALAADLSSGLAWAPPSDGGPIAYGNGGYFEPILDPRCRIVPMPEASLYGETARMRPTAVCQSRGLYADSVLFP
ncbi:MAG: hypothetical protein L0Y60_05865 [Beijerinckiaceae bacterium]|nr:hypothetical protein [Beijerinckiaceae bacterium]